MSKRDPDLKSVFIHIPKNAGMSIEAVLGAAGHASLCDMFSKDGLDLEGWNVSAIVRNPYDRMVSVWAHGRQVGDAPFEWPERFSDFVHQLPTKLWQTHARPQYSFLITKNGLGGKGNLFVGRFEKLDEAYRRICALHGIEEPPPLIHKNRSNHLPWREYYTPELIQVINRLYWEDFSYFDYPMLNV